MKIGALSSVLGAEITGIDISRPLDRDTVDELIDAWHQHMVVVVRDQTMSDSELVAFSKYFGRLGQHVINDFLAPDHPEILVISNIKENGRYLGLSTAGKRWHSDLQYAEEPAIGSIGYAVEMEGGDIAFANMAAAYEALDEQTKKRLDGLEAIHSYTQTTRDAAREAREKEVPDVVHRAVLAHPTTGRKALYVSHSMTKGFVGLPEVESQTLLDSLNAHATQEEFVYAHKYRNGDVVMWDNRSVMHRVIPYDPSLRRHLRRTTIMARDA